MDWIKENHIILATCSVAVAGLQVNETIKVPKTCAYNNKLWNFTTEHGITHHDNQIVSTGSTKGNTVHNFKFKPKNSHFTSLYLYYK